MKILYGIWTFWCAIVWVITLLITTPIYYLIFALGGKNGDRTSHKLSRIWAGTGLFLCGIIVKVYNREILDKNANYIFISNHRSMLDIPVCAVSTAHFFKFLAKEELVKVPLLGPIIKRLYITVNRSSVREKVHSYQKMREEINGGASVWIYPEGTRSDELLPLSDFQDGAFRLAKETGKKLAVAAIVDAGRQLPPKAFFPFKPGVIKVYWLGIINCPDTADCTQKAKEMITQKLSEFSRH
jgi:1-acyl-sn-glycerol-3-phosphate acyltransferase